MSVLTFVELSDGRIKKASLEAAYYGSKIASASGTDSVAVVLGTATADVLAELGQFGITKVMQDSDTRFNTFDSGAFTKALAKAADSISADTVVLSFNLNGKIVGPRLSVRLKAGLVPGASQFPEGNTVTKNVFSGKATATYQINTGRRVLALNPNSVQAVKTDAKAEVVSFSAGLSDTDFKTKVTGVNKVSGTVSLTEAEIVVSGGRGLKGPENWGMIETLAKEMGAATACSRPVADVDWRPHHEHVGQTGFTIKPNLYIAIGISGAIQHLAGVNQSKTIVVINSDPEAPFFKAADYGIIGDAFEVVPKLIEAYRNYKAAH